MIQWHWSYSLIQWQELPYLTTTMYIARGGGGSKASAGNISVWAEWLRQSGRGPSELPETSQWRRTTCQAVIQRVALHIALPSQFHHFFSLYWSPIINEHSGVVANCDHTSEWVPWVCACIGIAMWWVTQRKPRLKFLPPASQIQFSLY